MVVHVRERGTPFRTSLDGLYGQFVGKIYKLDPTDRFGLNGWKLVCRSSWPLEVSPPKKNHSNVKASTSWKKKKLYPHGCQPKNRGKTTKMDGENNGKPY